LRSCLKFISQENLSSNLSRFLGEESVSEPVFNNRTYKENWNYHHAIRRWSRVHNFVVDLADPVLQRVSHNCDLHRTKSQFVRIVELTLKRDEEQFDAFVKKRIDVLARDSIRDLFILLRLDVVVDLVDDRNSETIQFFVIWTRIPPVSRDLPLFSARFVRRLFFFASGVLQTIRYFIILIT
jgi:hypothetical protein